MNENWPMQNFIGKLQLNFCIHELSLIMTMRVTMTKKLGRAIKVGPFSLHLR